MQLFKSKLYPSEQELCLCLRYAGVGDENIYRKSDLEMKKNKKIAHALSPLQGEHLREFFSASFRCNAER